MSRTIADRVHRINQRIAAARNASTHAGDVTLLAASKTRTLEEVDAAAQAGVRVFGENYAQSFQEKASQRPELEWHFIGHLQRNKAKQVVPYVHTLHTLDRVSLADTLERLLERDIRVLIQVNVSEEVTKSGCAASEALALARHVVQHCPHLRLTGLMTMPPPDDDPIPFFRALVALRDSMASALHMELPVLSMGMSGDLESAVANGSTLVRVGSAIFGPRTA